MVEQAERRIAPLLNLGDDQPRTDCVDRPGGNQNAVALRHRVPSDKIGDRFVADSRAQLLRRDAPFQAQRDLGFRSSAEDVPGFGLAIL